jgi:hypothetical protein
MLKYIVDFSHWEWAAPVLAVNFIVTQSIILMEEEFLQLLPMFH